VDETTCLRPALQPTQHSLLYIWHQRLPLVVKQVGMKLTTRPDLVLSVSVPVLDNLSGVLKSYILTSFKMCRYVMVHIAASEVV